MQRAPSLPNPKYPPSHLRGRGVSIAPPNRFEKVYLEPNEEEISSPTAHCEKSSPLESTSLRAIGAKTPSTPTHYYRDQSQTIITQNASPDLSFTHSLNPYRGCEHGCAYCYARPYHEYLGFNSGIDFESKIMVKEKAPELLARELSASKWKPETLVCSGVTDPYQPIEKELHITRKCLEVLAHFRNPVVIITKNYLVTRDLDHLIELARHRAVAVVLTITTLDPVLSKKLEPRASSPMMRLEAIEKLTRAGIPTGISLAPVIPGLNEHEMPTLLREAALRGARFTFYTLLRLPYALKEMFSHWLDTHYPEKKEKILGRIRETRGGKLYQNHYEKRFTGEGAMANEIANLFQISVRRFGLNRQPLALSTESFRKRHPRQFELWE